MTDKVHPTPIDIHFGMRLRRRRRLLGLSQAAVGKRIGVGFQQIQKYESAANKMTAARLWQLSSVLGLEPSYFYDGLD